tara:strand:- start:1426 stop:1665 length:240 start_codon:yes stop_codon:yes gene_type:complete
MTLPILPMDIVCMILYKYKGIQTPTGRIMNERIEEWKKMREEQRELIESSHIKLDECYFNSFQFFSLYYERSIYRILFK